MSDTSYAGYHGYKKLEKTHPYAGRVLIGISPDNGKPFYADIHDSGVRKWDEAQAFAAGVRGRLPTAAELEMILKVQDKGDLKGTFGLVRNPPDAAWYWTSTKGHVDGHVIVYRTNGSRAGSSTRDNGSCRVVFE